MKPDKIQKRYLGPSEDYRSNRWELTCICGHKWVPTTTMFAKRTEECPKCSHSEVVDYNE